MGPVHRAVPEPDAAQRKELESKGYHWHDVARGLSPGGPKNEVPPSPGWTQEDWDKQLNRVTFEAGELGYPRRQEAPKDQGIFWKGETVIRPKEQPKDGEPREQKAPLPSMEDIVRLAFTPFPKCQACKLVLFGMEKVCPICGAPIE